MDFIKGVVNMLVKSIMLPKDKLITVSPKTSIGTALEIINKNNFLSIPVIEEDKFYGSISKERIYAFYFEKCQDKDCFLSDFNVESVMLTNIPTIDLTSEIEEAVRILEIKNIAFVAVVDSKGVFQGILTHHAVFEQFTRVFGVNKGKRLAVIAYDVPGQISRLSKILSENNADIISFVVVDPKSVLEVKEIVVRMNTENLELIKEKLSNAGFKII